MRPITYQKGAYVVFDQPTKGIRQMPYEIKEVCMRNTIGVIVCEVTSMAFPVMAPASTFFVANFVLQVLRRMTKAISKIELLEGGKQVRLTKKFGGRKIVADINKIQKLDDEASLLSTYAEPYMYPIEITDKKGWATKYYLYGQGFLPIKNGEVFRAIINGKELINETQSESSK